MHITIPSDDSQQPSRIQNQWLRKAPDSALAGKPVEKAETKAFGCTIERVRNHCEAGCHFSDWCSHALRGAPVAAHDEDAFGRTLAAKKSKVVLFDFWVTWRDPCRAELPELVKLERKWCGRGLVLVTAPADEPERETAALQFLVKRGVRFPALREARRE